MPQTREGQVNWVGDKNLTFYEEEFEKHFLQSLMDDYDKKAAAWVSTENARGYLLNVDKSLGHEEQTADFLLQPESKPKVLKKVEQELITKRAEAVLDKDTGCKHMFTHSLLDDLKLLYKCFKRDENTLGPIIQRMNPYIEQRG